MKTRATPENIAKYYQVLKNLKELLGYTSKISMLDFSKKNNVSKSLSTALQSGGIIKNTGGRGLGAEWKWDSIDPTREMAIRTLQELSKLNPERSTAKRGGKREGSGRKTTQEEISKHAVLQPIKEIERYVLTFFFGLIKVNIKPIYK